MDLNALMGAAQQDPKVAAFLQQMLSGGTSPVDRLPEIAPQKLNAPEIAQMPEAAPMPVFDPAKKLMDQLLGKYDPTQAAAGAAQATTPGPQQGPTPGGGTLDQMMGTPPAAMGAPPAAAGAAAPEAAAGGAAIPEALGSFFKMLLMGA